MKISRRPERNKYNPNGLRRAQELSRRRSPDLLSDLPVFSDLAPAFLEEASTTIHRRRPPEKRRKGSPVTPFSMDGASRLVEINLISAQGLKLLPGSRRFQTYAVAWIDSAAKLRTAVDRGGGENPTWNEKFVFRVTAALLSPDSPSALSVEIYALGGWYFPDSLVGAVRVLLGNLRLLNRPATDAPSFAAVGIRRPSGRIHGILNVGATVLSRVPVFVTEALAGTAAVGYRDFIGDSARPKLRRAVSANLISTPATADPALKECNREIKEGGSNYDGDGDGGGGAVGCRLGFPRKIHASPSDQNLAIHERKERRR